MLQYLYAAFSLKQTIDEGLTPESLAAVLRWRTTLPEIGAQEMLHLALVQNLLTAVGAAPRFARPNFPMRASAFPVGVRIELLPFGEAALRHFAFLERPDGMDVEDAEGFEAIARATALPRDERDEIVPHLQEFDTIGQLYRSIEAGIVHLDERLGPSRLSIGPPSAQATAGHSAGRNSWPSPTSHRRDEPSTRSSSRGRGPAASGATRTSDACWVSSTTSSRPSAPIRHSSRPGRSSSPTSGPSPRASWCP